MGGGRQVRVSCFTRQRPLPGLRPRQSLDEIKLLRYINAQGGGGGDDTDGHHSLKLLDYFYHREHLFIVTELLKDNLYEFGKYLADAGEPPYFTLPRVQRIARQVLTALAFIHGRGLVHCDLKPENILVSSYSRCDVKVRVSASWSRGRRGVAPHSALARRRPRPARCPR